MLYGRTNEVETHTSAYLRTDTPVRVIQRRREEVTSVVFGDEEHLVLDMDDAMAPRLAEALTNLPPREPLPDDEDPDDEPNRM